MTALQTEARPGEREPVVHGDVDERCAKPEVLRPLHDLGVDQPVTLEERQQVVGISDAELVDDAGPLLGERLVHALLGTPPPSIGSRPPQTATHLHDQLVHDLDATSDHRQAADQ